MDNIINKMSFVVHKKILANNYDFIEIPVEFLILHYSATSLSKTLEIFQNPKSKASSHLAINEDGSVYELVPCLEGTCLRAWHAGESFLAFRGKEYREFNNYSIGIELINKNGNFLEYTKEQYLSLKETLTILKKHYHSLQDPKNILGHEHIAGYRGKIDPGCFFNWPLFFKMNYMETPAPNRKAVLEQSEKKRFSNAFLLLLKKGASDKDWMNLNTQMENSQKWKISKSEKYSKE